MKKLLLIGLFASTAALAEERIEICYNYSCARTATVVYSDEQLERVRQWMLYAPDAATERRILRGVMGKLYGWAGQQAPISADRGGNHADDDADGRMDCIDHTVSTTRLLKMLQAQGWLRFHRVADLVERKGAYGLLQHFSASIEERPGRLEEWQLSTRLLSAPQEADNELRGPRFVVDSWFHDNGQPAEVLPLEEWLEGGGGPNV
ncbi:MAG: hypothetical protein RIR70_951 [Pseudomonadota bacterium]